MENVKPAMNKEGTNINIIDSIMGSGKTSWAIQFMNEADTEKNFIYITPFLSEVQRVKDAVTNRKFTEPQNKGNGKMDNLKKLIMNEQDIVSTHALFQNADTEIIDLLKAGNYYLILDEVMNVIDEFNLNKDDLNLLYDTGMITIDSETGIVHWNENSMYQHTKYNEVKNLSKNENLIYFENTILFWTFPVSIFNSFNEVYILTYLFQAQEQKYYYDMYQIQYEYKAVHKVDNYYVLVDHASKEPYDKEFLKALITIYDGKLNNIGDINYSLSKSWFEREDNNTLVTKMKRNIYSYFRNNVGTPTQKNMWTCYKDHKPKLKGKGYTKGFVSHNARATNEHREKQSLAYVINRFMHPYKYKFFKSKGVNVDQDLYALSELIQWIWRSRIRDGKSINLYIPSKRMRTLLRDYLSSDI
ncbi:DEAD/DEAH box helicase family protein [Terribacillus sp. AE2B 122]|uniref:DEAD/DEAH box helicase family protein n=1 Tax=Terribacillus sp. AE2B 122 TaxID=1331902 RepID=UPI0014407111|nr:DEAD/DEAH box helicase family protein [Terribacillus sp. AE2B 122]VVM35284.1 unknown [Terribacillus sp. AE2B 122]